jgi:hypothetical protein
MKLLLAILLMSSTNVVALNQCYSGAWYDLERPGEGINLDISVKGQLSGFFYTFATTSHVWFAMNGKPSDMTMYAVQKTSVDPWKATEFEVGAATILPITDDMIVFTYALHTDIYHLGDWCLKGYCSGQYVYTRITKPITCIDIWGPEIQ